MLIRQAIPIARNVATPVQRQGQDQRKTLGYRRNYVECLARYVTSYVDCRSEAVGGMSNRRFVALGILGATVLTIALSGAASAQTLPSGPITFADGNVTIGGDASVTFGPVDPGYFNHTD